MSKNKSSGKLYIDEDDITIHRQSTAIERDVRDREEAATLFVNQKMSSSASCLGLGLFSRIHRGHLLCPLFCSSLSFL
jgi:hypothetical protein